MNENIIKTRVDVRGTILQIPECQSVTFPAIQFTSMQSAKAAISRINAEENRTAYSISSNDNGVTFTITHNRNDSITT